MVAGTEGAGGVLPLADLPGPVVALFLEGMRTGHVKARKLSPILPVMVHKNLSDDDLKAALPCLPTVRLGQHRVPNSEPVTGCQRCRQKHRAGAQN